jgi:hypothetical protein
MKNLLQTALSEAKATKNQANVTSDKGNWPESESYQSDQGYKTGRDKEHARLKSNLIRNAKGPVIRYCKCWVWSLASNKELTALANISSKNGTI